MIECRSRGETGVVAIGDNFELTLYHGRGVVYLSAALHKHTYVVPRRRFPTKILKRESNGTSRHEW